MLKRWFAYYFSSLIVCHAKHMILNSQKTNIYGWWRFFKHTKKSIHSIKNGRLSTLNNDWFLTRPTYLVGFKTIIYYVGICGTNQDYFGIMNMTVRASEFERHKGPRWIPSNDFPFCCYCSSRHVLPLMDCIYSYDIIKTCWISTIKNDLIHLLYMIAIVIN